MESFKNRIREVRKSIGLSQQELADMVNVSKQAISQYERGVRKPDLDTLTALGDVLNVSIDYLTGQSDVTVRIVDGDGLKKLNAPYYTDRKTMEIIERIHKDPQYRILLDASSRLSPEDLDFLLKMIDRMEKKD